ncbi:hypothetical protein RND71_044023 [Anisodus tanguticus]|uniref:T-complex protein 1 subunit delta n=1 Tax=Anisodus tanguticus TaxID=243964 RepID=A0AAE1UR61_9SOLA|nr:hypothetical protein RND71_044023 [Anisodus tanguticus]
MAQKTMAQVAQAGAKKEKSFKDKSKPEDVRQSNMTAAKSVADAIRTSLGPKGMDKMIQQSNGEITISNDGATILKEMQVLHPAAKMLVELSKAQDVEAGDGTTSVVVIAGALLDQSQKLLNKGIHPTAISESFQEIAKKCVEHLEKNLAIPINLNETEEMIKVASTSLNSKIVSQYSNTLAPLAVQAVMKIKDNYQDNNVDLRDIKVVKKLGGTLEDTELINGLCLPHRFVNDVGTKKIEKAKIGLIQFCISPPKTDMDNQVVISDYAQMDRVLKEEKNYILNIVKQIKKTGCNVLFIQKSILRDALNEIALHFLTKVKIAVIKDIERDDCEFVCKALGCRPIASLDHFTAENLAVADCVEQVVGSKITKISGIQSQSAFGKTVNILLRGSNKMVIEEAERSIHDALCVIRCLVKKQALLVGGGAPEINLSLHLNELSSTVTGVKSICYRAFADALEIIPFTLAENAGLNPIQTVTELRQKHAQGEKTAGINVRKGKVTDILEENVLQPILVTISAITLAAETVRSILKIDDIVMAMR